MKTNDKLVLLLIEYLGAIVLAVTSIPKERIPRSPSPNPKPHNLWGFLLDIDWRCL